MISKSFDLSEKDFMRVHEEKKMIYQNQLNQKVQAKANNLVSVQLLSSHVHLLFKVLIKSVNL